MSIPRYVINFEELVNESLLPSDDVDDIGEIYEGQEFRSKGITIYSNIDEGMLRYRPTNDITLMGFIITKNRTEYFDDDHSLDKFDFYVKDNHIINDMNIFETAYYEFTQPIEVQRDTELTFWYRTDEKHINHDFDRQLYFYMLYLEEINTGFLNVTHTHMTEIIDGETGESSIQMLELYHEEHELEIGRYEFYAGDYSNRNLFVIDGILRKEIDIHYQELDKDGNLIPQEIEFIYAFADEIGDFQ